MRARPVPPIYSEYRKSRVVPFGEGGGRGPGIVVRNSDKGEGGEEGRRLEGDSPGGGATL